MILVDLIFLSNIQIFFEQMIITLNYLSCLMNHLEPFVDLVWSALTFLCCLVNSHLTCLLNILAWLIGIDFHLEWSYFDFYSSIQLTIDSSTRYTYLISLSSCLVLLLILIVWSTYIGSFGHYVWLPIHLINLIVW